MRELPYFRPWWLDCCNIVHRSHCPWTKSPRALILRPRIQAMCGIEIIGGRAGRTYLEFQATSIAYSCGIRKRRKADTSALYDAVLAAIAEML